jgi:hypothetical protein
MQMLVGRLVGLYHSLFFQLMKPKFLHCPKLQQSKRSIRGELLKLFYMNITQPLRLIASLQG